MSIGLIGRKVGMTQVFQDDGTMIPVSVVAIQPNTVTRLRTDDRDGYTAIQLGAGEREVEVELKRDVLDAITGVVRQPTEGEREQRDDLLDAVRRRGGRSSWQTARAYRWI